MLYHSLQVFELARDELPYDEEFLLAALLHDVGKAIDPAEHVARRPGGARRLHHPADGLADRAPHAGHALLDGTLGARASRRLKQHESFEELVALAECDRAGRVPGRRPPN